MKVSVGKPRVCLSEWRSLMIQRSNSGQSVRVWAWRMVLPSSNIITGFGVFAMKQCPKI